MNNTIIGRIPKNEDIKNYLCNIFVEKKISSAWVNVIGALDSLSLSYYSQLEKEYYSKYFNEPVEILSGQGNISFKDDEPFCHLHLSVSDKNYHVFGGHLEKSSVFACEFFMQPSDLRKKRLFNKETGLYLWN